MGWVMVVMPLALLIMGVPIFLLLLATCITAVTLFTKLPHPVVHQVMFDSLSKFPLIAVPFFIFTGDLMSKGGLSTRLLRWVASMVSGFRASLPLTSLGFRGRIRGDLGRDYRLGRRGGVHHVSAPARSRLQ
jgi:C4-dicarboxylate transporter, DctM subunit